jgi:hypothetical protein
MAATVAMMIFTTKTTWLAATVVMLKSPYDRLRCWASQPKSWSVALLHFATIKTKEQSIAKLIIAANHFISITCLTMSLGVAPKKNMGLWYNFFFNLSLELQEFKFYVYWSFFTIEYICFCQLVLQVHLNVQISMVYFYLRMSIQKCTAKTMLASGIPFI